MNYRNKNIKLNEITQIGGSLCPAVVVGYWVGHGTLLRRNKGRIYLVQNNQKLRGPHGFKHQN